jgi:hypothetical protein
VLWCKEMYLGVKLTRDGFVMVSVDCQLDWKLLRRLDHEDSDLMNGLIL